MSGLETIGLIAGLAGSAVTAAGTLAAGEQKQATLDYEAKQLKAKSLEEQAVGQQEASEYKRKKGLALSSLQAKSAASGFSATDPTSLALADEMAKYGTLQEQLAMYGGTSRRAGLEAEAEGRRMEGRAARTGAVYSALGTILGGVSSFASKYGDTLKKPISGYRYQ